MRTYRYLKTLAKAGLIASAAVLALSVGVAQACTGPYCEGPTGGNIKAQQKAADEAVALAQKISNPVDKALVLNTVKLSNQLAAEVNTLLEEAANAPNPRVKASLERAAVAESVAAKAMAQLAVTFAKATLRVEGKKPAADAAAAGHLVRGLSHKQVQRQVNADLNKAKVYAKDASSLNKRAAFLLRRGHATIRNQREANVLIEQAKADVAKAEALNRKAEKLLANNK